MDCFQNYCTLIRFRVRVRVKLRDSLRVRVRVRVRVTVKVRVGVRVRVRVWVTVWHLDMKASSTRFGCPFLAIMVLRTCTRQYNTSMADKKDKARQDKI
jgi:hypothetical protein